MNEHDLRVIKTEQHIEQAFLNLLQSKPYRAITVQDILDGANINRSTFYRHYPSKDALAEKMVADFYQPYEEFLKARFTLPAKECLPNFLERMTAFIDSQRHKILALWQIKTPTIHLYDDMYELIKGQYISHAKYREGNLDFQGHIYASLMLSVMAESLKKNYVFSLDDMRDEITRMFCNARMEDPKTMMGDKISD